MGLLVNGDGCLCLEELLSSHARTSAPSRQSDPTKSKGTKAKGKQASKIVETYAVEDQKIASSQDVSLRLPCASDAEVSESESGKMEMESAGDKFINGFGLALSFWVEATASVTADRTRRVTPFHSVRPPSLTVQDYLNRIRKYFVASDECYVIALVYIDRVGKIDPAMTVSELNVHRLLVIAAMLAAKFHDDVYYSNNYYAKVGGLCLKEVNALEAKFLKILDWKLFVGPEEYQLYHGLVCAATFMEKTGKEPEPEP